MIKLPQLPDPVANLIRAHDGPLTRQLLQSPGGFGLGKVPDHIKPDATTTMVCGFCSTGCGLNIHLQNGEAVNLTPDTNYPVNLGMACPKGWEALAVLDAPDRATTPMIRRNGRLEPVDWDTALKHFVERFGEVMAKHGPESVAFLSTGQIPTEEMVMLGALAKFGMGMIHGDGNTRQCMATAATAYKQSFGFDAPPYTYKDFEESDVMMFVGANPCIAHPIMWERVLKNPYDPTIIVVDPRKTETAMCATHHLPIAPKSDLTLFYGLAHLLISRGLINSGYITAHTTGFDAFAEHVAEYTPDIVAAKTGIDEATLRRVARAIGEGERVSIWWTMGVNQSYEGTRVAQALINLALMTGNMGRPGTGANSITGQCNAMGSRLFSNTTNLLGHHDFTSAMDRAKVAGVLGIPASRIPSVNSLAYDQIIEGIALDKIKGLWVIATNTSHSWINQKHARSVLDKLDFLVVQDMYHTTDTAKQAHLVLPAAAWGEKEGTFINSERRIGLIKKVRKAPGQALADFHIFKLIAHYWGCGAMFEKWKTPEDVFQTMKELSRGQTCDITGILDYAMLDRAGGIQWPYPESMTPKSEYDAGTGRVHTQAFEAIYTERRLFEDGVYPHADGRAKFIFEAPRPMPEQPDATYPMILLTGRGTASQWHTQTRTGKSAVLRKLYPQGIYIEINPVDARRLEIQHEKPVVVESRRGRITAKAFLTASVREGQVFIPMHYDTANLLTSSSFDPYSRQPNYKACAVSVRPVRYGDMDGQEASR
ncbi:MAG: molybdopterin-dependent oxidoreductase [Phycisphaera sp.]|nr:molybdopterin-dependent oxidoreductase [Phycisphaera sp.]